MVRCIVCHNDEPVKTYEIDEPVITIGRLPENTISIANMGVSRRHVRIERDVDRNYTVTDLNSLNGTYVNNKKVKKGTVKSGDKVSVGKYTIILEMIEPTPPPQTEQPIAAAAEPKKAARSDAPQPEAQQEKQKPAPPSAPASPVLIETGKHTVYPIEKRVMSLGNSETDDIFVSGFLVGDAHLIIEKRDDGIWISSGKKSGKFKVNGKKTTTHRLTHKDRIDIGTGVFAFMEDG